VNRIAAGVAGLIVILVAGLCLSMYYQGDPPPLPPGVLPPPPSSPSTVDHVVAFKQFVMVDRVKQPDWYARVSRVRLADGQLIASTTLPANWKDASTPSRPAESICGQLFAYAQRGAGLTWTSITVQADDGTPLVTRTGTAGSCRQLKP
jgi:hypothetical protein